MEAIGEIRPDRRLAGDATGEYWLARDRNLDRDCLLRLHIDAGDEAAEPIELQRLRFIEAARALASIDHATVARVLDYGVGPDGRPYMVLPAYPRRLTERLADPEPLDLKLAKQLIKELCTGLAVAHAQGVTHGGLTPSAIFLCDRAPHVRLANFYGGIGNSDKARPRTADDIFQLGHLAYRLLSGRPPVADAASPCTLNPALSPVLGAWTMRCLARDPAIRPDAAPAALAQLCDALAA